MATIYTMGSDDAYEQILKVNKANQRWCAFDKNIDAARRGEATRFGMTIWNYHCKSNSKEFGNWAITRDPATKTYWYRVAIDRLESQRNRKLLVDSLYIASGVTPNSRRLPMMAILKDQKSRRCAPDQVFNIQDVLMQADRSALWLRLEAPANGVRTEVKEESIPPMIALDSDGFSTPDDSNQQSQRTEISNSAFKELRQLLGTEETLDDAIASVPIESFPEDDRPAVSEILRTVWCRGPQHAAFRGSLKARWNSKCAVHGISCNDQLIASHIVPWSKDERLRGDVNNGLLLSVPLDKLFDKGYISFDENGSLIKSAQLDPMTADHFGVKDGLRLSWTHLNDDELEKIRKNLKWHRENWFEKAFQKPV